MLESALGSVCIRLLPDWNSIDSVRSARSGLELASIIFFGLLAVCDLIAHINVKKNDRLSHDVTTVGLGFFVIAVSLEIAAFCYGQRDGTLSVGVIDSLGNKANNAAQQASNALNDSRVALANSLTAGQLAGAVTREAGDLASLLKEQTSQLNAITPRFVLLGRSKKDLTTALIPYAGQESHIMICGRSTFNSSSIDQAQRESLAAWGVLYDELFASKWRDTTAPSLPMYWTDCRHATIPPGIMVFVSATASPTTQRAARSLSDALSKVLPTQLAPILAVTPTDLGLPPVAEDSPWSLVTKNPNLICILVSEIPLPISPHSGQEHKHSKHSK